MHPVCVVCGVSYIQKPAPDGRVNDAQGTVRSDALCGIVIIRGRHIILHCLLEAFCGIGIGKRYGIQPYDAKQTEKKCQRSSDETGTFYLFQIRKMHGSPPFINDLPVLFFHIIYKRIA